MFLIEILLFLICFVLLQYLYVNFNSYSYNIFLFKEQMKIIIFTLCVIAAIALHLPESHLATSFPTGQVTLKSDIGTFLGRCNGCGPAAVPDTAAVQQTNGANSWTIWTAERVGDKVAFKSDSGKYLTRCNNCWLQGTTGGADSATVHVPDSTGSWAQWTPEDLGNGKWALKGDNGKYLARCNKCVTGGAKQNFAFVNAASAIDNPLAQWTVQTLWSFPLGAVNLQSDIGTYLARCNNCGPSAVPDTAGVHETNPANSWAIWTAERVGDKVAFKSDSGKYLTRCNNCWKQGTTGGADSATVHVTDSTGPWAQWIPEDLGNGKWALKGDNGKYLARCNNCVTGGAVPNFAFVNGLNPSTNPLAQWKITKR